MRQERPRQAARSAWRGASAWSSRGKMPHELGRDDDVEDHWLTVRRGRADPARSAAWARLPVADWRPDRPSSPGDVTEIGGSCRRRHRRPGGCTRAGHPVPRHQRDRAGKGRPRRRAPERPQQRSDPRGRLLPARKPEGHALPPRRRHDAGVLPGARGQAPRVRQADRGRLRAGASGPGADRGPGDA